MGPAATAFTRTPRGLYSAVRLCVIESSAALVAPYAAPEGRPTHPAMALLDDGASISAWMDHNPSAAKAAREVATALVDAAIPEASRPARRRN
jgi:hypothetical protein